MPPRRGSRSPSTPSPRPPATTDQARENNLISLAFDVAEEQLHARTAPAAVIVQLLKYGSSREKLEQLKLAHEGELLATKKEILESEKRTEELIRNALEAMKSYQGVETDSDYRDDHDEHY